MQGLQNPGLAPQYKEFREDKQNFGDCFHLSPSGAEKMDRTLATLVPETLHQYYAATAPK